MKLKKIAALALAGVMAVSMLAGCAGKGTDDKNDTTDTSGVTAAAVIAKLDTATTKVVGFDENTALEATLKKAIEKVVADQGSNNVDATDHGTVGWEMTQVDTKLKSTEMDGHQAGVTDTTDVKVPTFVKVVALDNEDGRYTDAYVAKELASDIDSAKVCDGKTIANLYTQSGKFTDTKSGKDAVYSFTYTGNVAVVKVGNTYFAAFTVDRAATKVISNL